MEEENLFPMSDEDEDEEIIEEIQSNIGDTLEFDFKSGDFRLSDGAIKTARDIEALKQWIEQLSRTELDKYEIYKETGFGIDSKEMLLSGLPYDFVTSEIERELTEKIEQREDVESVDEFEFEREKRGLRVKLTVITIYGELESEVDVIGIQE